MTVRLDSGRKMRASRLCMPQSSAPQPFSGKGSCRAGTDAANLAPSVRSSLSAMVTFLPVFKHCLSTRGPPQRVEQAFVGDVEHPLVDLAPGGVLLVVRRRRGLVGFEGGRPAAQGRPQLEQVRVNTGSCACADSRPE